MTAYDEAEPQLTDGRFPDSTIESWRTLATKSLGGRPLESLTVTTHDDLRIKTLYTAEDWPACSAMPGQPPFTRGCRATGSGAWQICQRFDHPDPAVVAAQIGRELRHGVQGVWIVCALSGDAASGGVVLGTSRDLTALLDAADLTEISIHLSAGAESSVGAALLAAALQARKSDLASVSGSLGCDPLGALASAGFLAHGTDRSLQLMTELAEWCRRHAPGLVPITVSSLPYHGAGANAVQELAFTIASGVEYLRSLGAAGYELGRGPAPLLFRMAIARDLFTEIAKLRAARLLWSRVMAACGALPAHGAVAVHAVSSARCLTVHDPWVNLLRVTVAGFAAACGGADIVTTLAYDSAIGLSDEPARRLAANTQTVLQEESHLARVADPAGGSWYVERLTADLACAAWQLFQEIEAAGGMRTFLEAGSAHRLVDQAMAKKRRAIATRRDPVTGVSSYPDLGEQTQRREAPELVAKRVRGRETLERGTGSEDALQALAGLRTQPTVVRTGGAVMEAAVAAAIAGATAAELNEALADGSPPSTALAMALVREGEAFESLRDASDRWLAEHGGRPRIFLAALASPAEHRARVDFAKSFFNAAGIETLDQGGFDDVTETVEAFSRSGAKMAAICSSDRLYEELATDCAEALKARGARTVLLAGRPGEHEKRWRSAGVDHFIFAGCDALRTLSSVLAEAGVVHV